VLRVQVNQQPLQIRCQTRLGVVICEEAAGGRRLAEGVEEFECIINGRELDVVD